MRICCELAIKDVVALGRNLCQHNPVIRRAILIHRIVNGTVAFVLILILALALKTPWLLIYAVIGVPVAVIMASNIYVNMIQNNFRKIYGDPANRHLLGPREMELTDHALIERSPHCEEKVSLDTIWKIVSDELRTYIYVGSAKVFVIREGSVTEGNYDEFVATVREKAHGAVNSQV